MNEKLPKGSALLTKTAFSYGWNAYTAAFGRFFFGAIISILAAAILPGTSLRLGRKQLQKLLPLSLIYAANPVLLYHSYRYVSSGLASTLHFTYPVIVMLMMALLFHSRPQKKQIVCVILCALGILLLYRPDGQKGSFGMALALASGIVYSFYIVLIGKNSLNGLSTLTFTFWISLFGAVETGIFAALTGHFNFSPAWQGWLAEAGLGLFASVIALALFQRGVVMCGEVKASLLCTLEPLTRVVIGLTVFREKLTLAVTGGILLILLSVLLLVAPIESLEKHMFCGKIVKSKILRGYSR